MKTMRKTLALLLVLSLVFGLIPVFNVAAADASSGYCGGEGDGTNLQWTLSENGELTITGKGAMADYSWEELAPWNAWQGLDNYITKLSLPDGLTTIGDYAFFRSVFLDDGLSIPETVTAIGDSAFTSCGVTSGDLYIPDSVTKIGEGAFSYFQILNDYDFGQLHLGKGLQSIGTCAFSEMRVRGELTLPDSLTELGTMAFWCCSSLEHVTFGKNLTKIGDGAFGGCAHITGDLTLPEGLIEIGPDAFSECTRLFEPLVIPDSVETIGDEAFYKCFGFPEIRLGKGVKTIGECAFYDCYRVVEPVIIPENVTEIGDGAFSSMDQLPGFICEGNNFCVRDGLLYTGDGKKLLCWPETKKDAFYIPEGTTSIGGYLCMHNDALTGTLVIPEGVAEIGDCAFCECKGLTNLQLPSTLRSIGSDAFADCSGMTGDLILPDGLEMIGDFAFGRCGFTGNLWIPDSVTKIEEYAFALTGFGDFAVIGKNVELIGDCAFEDCLNLQDVYFRGGVPQAVVDFRPDHYEHPDPFDEDCRLHFLEGTRFHLDDMVADDALYYLVVHQVLMYEGPFAEPFRDVAPGQYFTVPIAWAVGERITTGKTATKFAPDASCTRGQMVTFLWRAVGCPEPEANTCPFHDVAMDAYYAKAVLWASENGIVNGMGDGVFAPDKTVTRGQMATILYRYADGKAEGDNPFKDVASDAYYYDAVRWAFDYGITYGLSETSFGPDKLCTRGQIVTFLYRFFDE